jgi:hypothetical protein
MINQFPNNNGKQVLMMDTREDPVRDWNCCVWHWTEAVTDPKLTNNPLDGTDISNAGGAFLNPGPFQQFITGLPNRPEIGVVYWQWPVNKPWLLKITALVGQNASVGTYLILDLPTEQIGLDDNGRLTLKIIAPGQTESNLSAPQQQVAVSQPGPVAQVGTVTNPSQQQVAKLVQDAGNMLRTAGINAATALQRLLDAARARKMLDDSVANTQAALDKLVKLAKGVGG